MDRAGGHRRVRRLLRPAARAVRVVAREPAGGARRAVARRRRGRSGPGACYDCHSNETEWPAYSWVAPMSWLVRSDVEGGRDELNFSDWDEYGDEADDAAEAIEDGSMPPHQYQLMHPDARLSDEEVAELVAALESMDEDEEDEDDEARTTRVPEVVTTDASHRCPIPGDRRLAGSRRRWRTSPPSWRRGRLLGQGPAGGEAGEGGGDADHDGQPHVEGSSSQPLVAKQGLGLDAEGGERGEPSEEPDADGGLPRRRQLRRAGGHDDAEGEAAGDVDGERRPRERGGPWRRCRCRSGTAPRRYRVRRRGPPSRGHRGTSATRRRSC